jgi:two-component system, sensor histidine kinase ChiS
MKYFQLLIIILTIVGCNPTRKIPRVEKGVIDLRDWNFQENGSVELEGEWEFYWKELLTNEEIDKKVDLNNRSFLKVPDSWNNQKVNQMKLEGKTFGTYRIKILMPLESKPIGIKNVYVSTAYKLLSNNKEIFKVGEIGDSPEKSQPKSKLLLHEVPYSPEINLVLQISNFHHYKGGLRRAVKIGDLKKIINERNWLVSIDLLLAGSLIIMGFYHLFTYILRRDDQSNFFFGILCFLIFLRILFAGEIFITTLYEDISYYLLTRIEYSSIYIGFPIFILYLYTCYKNYMPFYIVIGTLLISIPFVALLFFGDIYILTQSLLIYTYILVLTIIIVLLFLMYLVYKKEYAALYLLISGVIFGLTIFNDILHNHNFINTAYVSPYGFFVVIFAQSILISVRFTSALRESERDREFLESKEKDLIISKMEVEKLNRTKDDFLSNLSHEIKTPLSYVYAYSELLKDTVKEDNKQYAIEIYLNAKKLNDYINDLFLITEIETKIKLNKKEINLYDLIESILKNYENLILMKEIIVLNQIDRNQFINIDIFLVEKALSNIIKNAIIYNTNRGKINITFIEKENHYIITISDTGIGIQKEYFSKVFEKFYRINSDYEFEGVGIGLYISEKIVQFHNGRIEIESTPKKGSQFKISLE